MDEHVEVLQIVHLDCDNDDEMVKRLKTRAAKEGRRDDASEDVIRHRLKVYREETRPILDHYDPSIIKSVNAIGTPAEVLQHVLEVVAPVQKSRFANALTQ